jgi:hypothetical protein
MKNRRQANFNELVAMRKECDERIEKGLDAARNLHTSSIDTTKLQRDNADNIEGLRIAKQAIEEAINLKIKDLPSSLMDLFDGE